MTPDGKRALRRLRGLARQLDDDFLAPLSDAERRHFSQLKQATARHYLNVVERCLGRHGGCSDGQGCLRR